MYIKNLTYVVPTHLSGAFLSSVFSATDAVKQWVDSINAFKLIEQVDPDTYNYTIQLCFSSNIRLETFNNLVLENMLADIQNGFSEGLLYFESHLHKQF